MRHANSKIWFITGISSGIGKALAEAVIDKHDFVIGTFRNEQQVDDFNAEYAGEAFALQLDVTNSDDIARAFHTINTMFGRIDVLVNNAGFGFAGAIEETSIEESRAIMEANFFGALQITQAALPLMRAQKSGHIIQISSQAGFKAGPGFGVYNASKFALEGFSEALAMEVANLGIKVVLVELGLFRTNFAGSSFKNAANQIDDYKNSAGAFRRAIPRINGTQESDPLKAADAIIQIAYTDKPPLRLALGKSAVAAITGKLQQVQKELDENMELTLSVGFV